jgi:hypothetical protein
MVEPDLPCQKEMGGKGYNNLYLLVIKLARITSVTLLLLKGRSRSLRHHVDSLKCKFTYFGPYLIHIKIFKSMVFVNRGSKVLMASNASARPAKLA